MGDNSSVDENYLQEPEQDFNRKQPEHVKTGLKMIWFNIK